MLQLAMAQLTWNVQLFMQYWMAVEMTSRTRGQLMLVMEHLPTGEVPICGLQVIWIVRM